VRCGVRLAPSPPGNASYRHGPNRVFQLAVRPPSRRAFMLRIEDTDNGTLQAGIQPPTSSMALWLAWAGTASRESRASQIEATAPPLRQLLAQRPRLSRCFMTRRNSSKMRQEAERTSTHPPNATTKCPTGDSSSAAQQAAFAAEGRGRDPFPHRTRPRSAGVIWLRGEMAGAGTDLGGDMVIGPPRPGSGIGLIPLQSGGGRRDAEPWLNPAM